MSDIASLVHSRPHKTRNVPHTVAIMASPRHPRWEKEREKTTSRFVREWPVGEGNSKRIFELSFDSGDFARSALDPTDVRADSAKSNVCWEFCFCKIFPDNEGVYLLLKYMRLNFSVSSFCEWCSSCCSWPCSVLACDLDVYKGWMNLHWRFSLLTPFTEWHSLILMSEIACGWMLQMRCYWMSARSEQ